MQFVAAAPDRIPRFCPEELNDYTVAENQPQLNTRVSDLAGIVTDSVKQQAQLEARVADLTGTVSGSVKQLQEQVSNFQDHCGNNLIK